MPFDRNKSVDGAALIASVDRCWLVDEGYAASMELTLDGLSLADVARVHAEQKEALRLGGGEKPQYTTQDGIAYIELSGPMTKNETSMSSLFGGASTKAVGSALKAAAADKSVNSIMIVFDTPGGTVDGSFDLANTVRLIGRQKPIDAYVEDNCMSAGYLVAAQCRTIYANVNALVGSIGVYTQLVDTSKMDQMRGVKRITVYAGEYKAIGAPGREVTDEHVSHVQERMGRMMGLFAAAVMEGRGFDEKKVAKVANGDVFVGEQARKLGLVDAIKTVEAAHAAALKAGTAGKTKGARMANEIDVAEVRGWLAAADSDGTELSAAAVLATAPAALTEAPAALTAQQPAAAAAESTAPALAAALLSHNITSVGTLDALVAMAGVGNEYVSRVRVQCKQLAVLAIGPELGAAAAATIDMVELPVLRGMAQSYEAIAVKAGLLPPAGGAPMQRTTAAGDHPQVGLAPAVADASGAIKPTQQQLSEAHMAERTATGIYHL